MKKREELTKIFSAIEKLEEEELKALINFDTRIQILYNHKQLVKNIIKELESLKKTGSDEPIKKIEGYLKELKKELHLAFGAHLPETKLSKRQKKIIQVDLNRNLQEYEEVKRSLARTKAGRIVLEEEAEIVAAEEGVSKRVQEFNQRIEDFKNIFEAQKTQVQQELALIKEIKNSGMLSPTQIDGFIHQFQNHQENIERLLKEEKENIHDVIEDSKIEEDTKRVFRRAARFIKRKSRALNIKMIKQDVATLTTESDYNLYTSVILSYFAEKGVFARLVNLFTRKTKPILKYMGELRTKSAEIGKAQREAKAELEDMAYLDLLTKIPTRGIFNDFMQNLLGQYQRKNLPDLSLLIMDIDKFKDFNDVYGHDVGDRVLVFVAKIIAGKRLRVKEPTVVRSRTTDMAARWGGEEFVVALPGTDLEGALAKAEKIRKAIEKESQAEMADINSKQKNVEKKRDKITVSIGVANIKEIQGTSFDKLFKLADIRMYIAKDGGRNRVVATGTEK